MAPKLNSDAAKPNSSNGQTAVPPTATPNPYAPSVPIPVYRELAAELQATKAMLESLNTQNQALARQNALLKREVQTIVQSALQLQNVIATPAPAQRPSPPVTDNAPAAIAPPPVPQTNLEPPATRKSDRLTSPSASAKPAPSKNGKSGNSSGVVTAPPTAVNRPDQLPPEDIATFFTEQQEAPQSIEKAPRQLSGLWLLLVVLVIMVTAFSAGFLVMRPILMKNSQ